MAPDIRLLNHKRCDIVMWFLFQAKTESMSSGNGEGHVVMWSFVHCNLYVKLLSIPTMVQSKLSEWEFTT